MFFMVKSLGKVQTFKFNKKILIALDEQWCQIFNDDIPTFDAVIDKDDRYTLRGPSVKLPRKDVNSNRLGEHNS